MSREFWEEWVKGEELKRLDLIKTLILPCNKNDKMELHICASLINSYLIDLHEYMRNSAEELIKEIDKAVKLAMDTMDD